MAGLGFSWGQNQGQGRSYGGDYQGGLLTRALGATFGDAAPGVDWWTRFSNPEYNTAKLDQQRSMAEWEAKRKEFEPFVNEMQRSFEAGDEHGALNNAMLLGQVLMKNGLDPQGAIDLYKNTGEAYRMNKVRSLDPKDAGAYERGLAPNVNTFDQARGLGVDISAIDENKANIGKMGADQARTEQTTRQEGELFPIQKEGEGLKNSLTGAQIGEVGARTSGQILENTYMQRHNEKMPTHGYGQGDTTLKPLQAYRVVSGLNNQLAKGTNSTYFTPHTEEQAAEMVSQAQNLLRQSGDPTQLRLRKLGGGPPIEIDGKTYPAQDKWLVEAVAPAPSAPGGGVPVDTSGAPRRSPQAPPQQEEQPLPEDKTDERLRRGFRDQYEAPVKRFLRDAQGNYYREK